jgi:hypothetical protein
MTIALFCCFFLLDTRNVLIIYLCGFCPYNTATVVVAAD